MTGIQFPARANIFLFAVAFRLAEEVIQPLIQWVLRAVYLVIKWYKFESQHDTVLYKAQKTLPSLLQVYLTSGISIKNSNEKFDIFYC
jgi:hypothetical protein